MANVIYTINQLLNCLPCYLLGDDPYLQDTEHLFGCFGRLEDYRGRWSSTAPSSSSNIVIVSPHWFEVVDQIEKQTPQPLFIFLPPVGDRWGYYNFLKETPGNSPVKDAMVLAGNVFGNYLEKFGLGKCNLQGELLYLPFLYWENRRYIDKYVQKHKHFIDAVANFLGDEKSKSLYKSIFIWNPHDFINHFIKTLQNAPQYFDFLSLKQGDVVLDCGIEGGFEIPLILTMIGSTGQLHCVDPLGFQFLTEFVKPLVAARTMQIVLHTVALADHEGEIPLELSESQMIFTSFNPGSTESGRQLHHCPCTRLLTLVEKAGLQRLDLIKLDLEGSEEFILNDLIVLIKKFRPQVAIAIYHKLQDLLEIPLLLMMKTMNYRFYVRHYSFVRYETVLYLIPEERVIAPWPPCNK